MSNPPLTPTGGSTVVSVVPHGSLGEPDRRRSPAGCSTSTTGAPAIAGTSVSATLVREMCGGTWKSDRVVVVVVVVLETTTAPRQPTPTDDTSRLGCLCYTTTSAWHISPGVMKAIAARIAVSLAAHVRLARSPDVDACHHAENTPPVSQILAHHERQSSLVVDQVVGRQLPLRIVAAAH